MCSKMLYKYWLKNEKLVNFLWEYSFIISKKAKTIQNIQGSVYTNFET